MKYFLTGTAMAAVLAFCAPASATATQPEAGIYRESFLITKAKGLNGGTCRPDLVNPANREQNYNDNWTFQYPGPSQDGAVEYGGLLSPDLYAKMTIINFPRTPRAGMTTWSGTLDGDPDQQGAASVSFVETFTFVDSQSFLATMTAIGPGENGIGQCEITSNRAFIRQGK